MAVHDEESMELAAELMRGISMSAGVAPGLVLHSDNGGPMKGSTMLATLQRLGVVTSFSRPAVSNDNPYSESTFRTMKLRVRRAHGVHRHVRVNEDHGPARHPRAWRWLHSSARSIAGSPSSLEDVPATEARRSAAAPTR
jgi:transposase InsO family protein